MKQSIRIGRIAGIPIGANWSVVVIVGLITGVLAADVLPDLAPDQAWAAYVGVAVVAAVLFFASLVTHELAHSLVARRYGVEVRGITLWMFGGVSEIETELAEPTEELRMAVAGPATSFGLGAGFFAASVVAAAVALPDLVVAALWWLAFVNAGLGVFNLLPAYPMDGGRVLRAALWTRSGDRVGATVTSARVSRWFAYGIMGLGVLLAMAGGVVEGVWLVFIGWFLDAASRGESSASIRQAQLDHAAPGDPPAGRARGRESEPVGRHEPRPHHSGDGRRRTARHGRGHHVHGPGVTPTGLVRPRIRRGIR